MSVPPFPTVEAHHVVLPILITQKNGDVACIGTGFVIVANGRQAMMITAAHVFEEIRKVEQPFSTQHPTTGYIFPEVRFLHLLKHVIPRAIYFDGTAAHSAVIELAIEMPKPDLCVCSIRFGPEIPSEVQFIHRLPINTRPVVFGEAIRPMGYAEMTTSGRSSDSDEIEYAFAAQLRKPTGRVTDVFINGGPRGQKHPCFQIDVPLDPGMSGGPVLSEANGVHYARGVISSDETSLVDGKLKATGAAAFASMLWPIMMMPIKPPDKNGNVSSGILLDLQRDGIIWDTGDACQHVHCIRDNNGQVTDCHWA